MENSGQLGLLGSIVIYGEPSHLGVDAIAGSRILASETIVRDEANMV
jgi:hypothetical protein